MVKKQLAVQETRVQSLGRKDPLEEEMATYSSMLAWEIPWPEQLGRLQSKGSQRIRYDWVTNSQMQFNTKKGKKIKKKKKTLPWVPNVYHFWLLLKVHHFIKWISFLHKIFQRFFPLNRSASNFLKHFPNIQLTSSKDPKVLSMWLKSECKYFINSCQISISRKQKAPKLL